MKLGAFLICLGLYIALQVPVALSNAVGNSPQSAEDWFLVIGLGFIFGGIPLIFGVRRVIKARRQRGD